VNYQALTLGTSINLRSDRFFIFAGSRRWRFVRALIVGRFCETPALAASDTDAHNNQPTRKRIVLLPKRFFSFRKMSILEGLLELVVQSGLRATPLVRGNTGFVGAFLDVMARGLRLIAQ
jgi:hypothetical protein